MSEQLNPILVGATFKRINVADIKALFVVCPPRCEQDEIVAFIERETAKLDGLHRSYERQLGLLAEYRASLIHECVTGQREVGGGMVRGNVDRTQTRTGGLNHG